MSNRRNEAQKDLRLFVENLRFAYGKDREDAVRDVSLRVYRGEFVGLIGPNGSGKSTVLKTIYRALKPDAGRILLDGEELARMRYRDSAKKLAVLGQENEIPFDFRVEEIVAMGRSPHKTLFEIDKEYDRYIVHHALEHLGMQDYAKQSFLSLSGGEKQRVLLARAIAQESDFLILDEPTNHLDISYQLQMMDFVKRLKITVLSAIHDLNLAAMYCDYLYVMKEGKIVLAGTPGEVLTPENVEAVYGVRCFVEERTETGKQNLVFLPSESGGRVIKRQQKESILWEQEQ